MSPAGQNAYFGSDQYFIAYLYQIEIASWTDPHVCPNATVPLGNRGQTVHF
jgi:hypothetical protein